MELNMKFTDSFLKKILVSSALALSMVPSTLMSMQEMTISDSAKSNYCAYDRICDGIKWWNSVKTKTKKELIGLKRNNKVVNLNELLENVKHLSHRDETVSDIEYDSEPCKSQDIFSCQKATFQDKTKAHLFFSTYDNNKFTHYVFRNAHCFYGKESISDFLENTIVLLFAIGVGVKIQDLENKINLIKDFYFFYAQKSNGIEEALNEVILSLSKQWFPACPNEKYLQLHESFTAPKKNPNLEVDENKALEYVEYIALFELKNEIQKKSKKPKEVEKSELKNNQNKSKVQKEEKKKEENEQKAKKGQGNQEQVKQEIPGGHHVCEIGDMKKNDSFDDDEVDKNFQKDQENKNQKKSKKPNDLSKVDKDLQQAIENSLIETGASVPQAQKQSNRQQIQQYEPEANNKKQNEELNKFEFDKSLSNSVMNQSVRSQNSKAGQKRIDINEQSKQLPDFIKAELIKEKNNLFQQIDNLIIEAIEDKNSKNDDQNEEEADDQEKELAQKITPIINRLKDLVNLKGLDIYQDGINYTKETTALWKEVISQKIRDTRKNQDDLFNWHCTGKTITEAKEKLIQLVNSIKEENNSLIEQNNAQEKELLFRFVKSEYPSQIAEKPESQLKQNNEEECLVKKDKNSNLLDQEESKLQFSDKQSNCSEVSQLSDISIFKNESSNEQLRSLYTGINPIYENLVSLMNEFKNKKTTVEIKKGVFCTMSSINENKNILDRLIKTTDKELKKLTASFETIEDNLPTQGKVGNKLYTDSLKSVSMSIETVKNNYNTIEGTLNNLLEMEKALNKEKKFKNSTIEKIKNVFNKEFSKLITSLSNKKNTLSQAKKKN
jgi:hypothetical protein